MTYLHIESADVSFRVLGARDLHLKRRAIQAIAGKSPRIHMVNALKDVNLNIEAGDRVALLGHNGAGKSTLLSLMAGMLPATRGSVSASGRVMSLLGGANTWLDLDDSGQGNAVTMGVKLGESPKAMRRRLDEITEFSGLGDRMTDPVYTYSTGMQARLRFSVITALNPDILLLDEGIGTADAEFNRRARARMDEFMGRAGIVVMASHSDELLRENCTSAVLLDRGSIVARGDLESVLASYAASQ